MTTTDRPATYGEVKRSTRRSTRDQEPPLPPCACGARVVAQFGGNPPRYVCAACYERDRPMSWLEIVLLSDRTGAPPRHADETTTQYFQRAYEASRPTESER